MSNNVRIRHQNIEQRSQRRLQSGKSKFFNISQISLRNFLKIRRSSIIPSQLRQILGVKIILNILRKPKWPGNLNHSRRFMFQKHSFIRPHSALLKSSLIISMSHSHFMNSLRTGTSPHSRVIAAQIVHNFRFPSISVVIRRQITRRFISSNIGSRRKNGYFNAIGPVALRNREQ